MRDDIVWHSGRDSFDRQAGLPVDIISILKLSHDIARDRIWPDIRSVGCSPVLGPCFSLFLVGLIADATPSECIASHEYV